jgi:hypothetical protein
VPLVGAFGGKSPRKGRKDLERTQRLRGKPKGRDNIFLIVFSRFIVYFADDLYNNEKKIGEFKGEPL